MISWWHFRAQENAEQFGRLYVPSDSVLNALHLWEKHWTDFFKNVPHAESNGDTQKTDQNNYVPCDFSRMPKYPLPNCRNIP